MSKPLNYSKWDRLEISDDEKDAHPNIDTSLMVRIKREQRARREAEEQMKIAQLRKMGTPEALEQIDEIQKKSKLNVDNICRVVDEKTIVNRSKAPISVVSATSSDSSDPSPPKSEEDEFEDFVERYEGVIREYSHLSDYEESEKFLLDHLEILNDHACGWMLLHQLTLEMAGDRKLMLNVTKQYLMLRNIIDLAAEAKKVSDARPMVHLFFKQISSDASRQNMLDTETTTFAQQIINRAIQKKKEMDEEAKATAEDPQ